ncbi:MAG TPA: aldehyde dehydrogenase family protein [Thermoanaerobaculia bacterium]|nr:aldehyde dehydrogenase family protein [Thermoanaerobaculia bacterium]
MPAPPIRVVSPATGELLAEVPDEGAAGAASAVAAARSAAPEWASRPLADRVEALKRWRDAVVDSASSVAATLVSESGKPRHEAEVIEILYLCELIRFGCRAGRRALAEETRNPLLFVTKKTRLTRTPLGVVGVIGPWNFPILNNAADGVGPLLMGNTVVLKPSEVTPLTSLALRDLWVKAGNPPDVFQVVTGRGEAGAELVNRVDGIMFTGSVATGRKVASRAGERLIPCVTELGGKSPFVVLAGADLEWAAEAAAWSSFVHSGQVCVRTERIYVQEEVAARFEALLVDRVRALRRRPPGSRSREPYDVGAVTFAPQIAVVERQIADATARGASVAVGGARQGDPAGQFFPPTVLLGATQDMEVMKDETFGPLVPVMRVKDAEEALRLANDTHLGLNATVFGRRKEAVAFARRLQSGQVIVNDVLVNYFVVESPLGGWKASGLGFRHGVESLRQWTRTEAVTEGRPLLAPIERLVARKLAFPYDPRFLALIRRATRLLYRRGISAKLRRPAPERSEEA